ncbi:MAG: transposase [Deltaproteobacteria bacterium]|jgi:transposase|nr:transposase [Deltaproteobacteria bacterium]
MTKLYTGIDLHSNNNYIGIIDDDDRRVYKKRLPNKEEVILAELEPFKKELTGIVVESTFNWYWLADCLMDAGYKVHLANPAGIQKYKGLKYSNDAYDSFWLAHLLRLNILPEGYIYPKEDRPVRDLLRKRGHLVKLRTSLINSLQGIINRNCGFKLTTGKIRQVSQDNVTPLLAGEDDLALSGAVSKDTIDYLSQQITRVPTSWTSNNKNKGKGNKKNGNKYLAWAFSEAAEFARRYNEMARTFYNRKLARTNRMVAHAALAHKLARASYYIMRDNVEFDNKKLFA